MFIFYFLYIGISIILIIVLSHIFLTLHLKNYDLKVKEYKKMWQKTQLRCRQKKDYRLKKREIKKLKNPQMLAAFYEVYSQSPKEEFLQLFTLNKKQIIAVARKYRSTTMKAYFAYLLSIIQMHSQSLSSGFDDLMAEYVLDDSVYARENALKALYSFGNAEKVVASFKALSEKNIYHSEKLLTDGLMTFRGDFENLSSLLMKHFDKFIECYQISIINCFAYRNEHAFDQKLIQYINGTDVSMDIKCSVLRIIGKVKCEENKQILLSSLAQYNNEDGWEQAAVAASMLDDYVGDEEVITALYQAITSKNWYVRMNSAGSLIKVGESDENIDYILNCDDKYATNALAYAMSLRKEMAE